MSLKVFKIILLSIALILFCVNIFRIINGIIEEWCPLWFKIRIDELKEILTGKTSSRLAEWRGDPFQTEPWYMRKYGIKTINLLPAVEEYLHLMIKKVIEAGSGYYLKADDKEIEKVRSLFLEEEFENLKRKINEARRKEELSLIMEVKDCGILTQSLGTKFSKPRKYKLLENRLGIMVYIPFKAFNFLKGGCWDHHSFLFIFKQDENKEWKIERIELLGIFKLPAPRLLEMEEEAAILRIKKGIRI
jgi:hypothetical protein